MNTTPAFALVAALLVPVWGYSQEPPEGKAPIYGKAQVDLLKQRIVKRLPDFEKRVTNPKPDPTVRDLPSAALCYLVLGENPGKAEALLRHMFKQQEMNPGSPRYGSFPWQEGHPEIEDTNSDEFTLMPTGAIFVQYADKLSENFKNEAAPHLKAGIAALRRRDVKVAYTNIYVMKVASMLLLGEALNDVSAIDDARKELANWIDFTHKNGLTEYDSSTYSPVQMECLATAFDYTKQADLKPILKGCLDFLWSDYAANYFSGAETLSGPQSRYYDFLFGDQNINQIYYLAGLRQEAPGDTLLSDAARIWTNAARPGYRPESATLALADLPERIIRQQFGPEPGRDRYNYVTADYAAGSVSAFYGNQDNQLSISVRSKKKLPFIEYMADSIDAPYGKTKFAEKSGHQKPKHEREIIASVQAKGVILALTNLGQQVKNPVKSLATNIIVPTGADAIYLDDKKVEAGGGFDLPAGKDSIVFIREGKSAVAVRIFAADGAAGQVARFAFKFDGNEWGAARLVAYHYQGEPRQLTDHAIRAGMLMVADHCESDEAFAQFVKAVRGMNIELKGGGEEWSAAVTAPDGTKLEASLSHNAIAYRRINGKDVTRTILEVNGSDLDAKYLAPLATAGGSPGSGAQ